MARPITKEGEAYARYHMRAVEMREASVDRQWAGHVPPEFEENRERDVARQFLRNEGVRL